MLSSLLPYPHTTVCYPPLQLRPHPLCPANGRYRSLHTEPLLLHTLSLGKRYISAGGMALLLHIQYRQDDRYAHWALCPSRILNPVTSNPTHGIMDTDMSDPACRRLGTDSRTRKQGPKTSFIGQSLCMAIPRDQCALGTIATTSLRMAAHLSTRYEAFLCYTVLLNILPKGSVAALRRVFFALSIMFFMPSVRMRPRIGIWVFVGCIARNGTSPLTSEDLVLRHCELGTRWV